MGREWHAMNLSEVGVALASSETGLTSEEAAARLSRDGPNELTDKGGTSRLEVLLKQLKEPLVLILVIAAATSVAVGIIDSSMEDMVNAAVILMIVALNTALGYSQEYKAERTLEALQELASPKVSVLRDGGEVEIPSRELVVGDVILLSIGDRVSADGRLLDSANLEIDEASLTGESFPVKKDHEETLVEGSVPGDRTNMVYSGSIVSKGRGKAMVTSTGSSTELGRIADLATGSRGPTPLQRKLAVLSRQLGIVVIAIAAFLMIIGILKDTDALTMFLTAISLAVAAIPEGLPAVVTISLAIGLQRMARRNALVRSLPAVEALGNATAICTDKTGTLTAGVMNIREVTAPERTIRVTGEGYDPEGILTKDGGTIDSSDPSLTELLRAGVLCNDATLVKRDRWEVIGDGTEGTLLVLAKKAGMDPEAERVQYPRIGEEPFDPERRRMTTVHMVSGEVRSYTKGATEAVLPLCTHVLVDGHRSEMDNGMRDSYLAKDREMASRALRVLALACGQGEEEGLTFLGMVGMMDSPRDEAIAAVATCRSAGIRVIMITGDHRLTAEAIAEEMKIPSLGGSITGRELSYMDGDELSRRIEDVNVFARVAPEQKVRIVEALQGKGHVVAMTGDGVNDAPALKRADIGVAMGIAGTDVAKESAEIILADDNFASIVAAVEEGRGIYSNIRKFVVFLLSCNVGEIILLLLATVLVLEPGLLPFLLPIQILWVNLVTDGLPAIALGLEPASPDVMDRCPQDPDEPPITRRMMIRITLIGSMIGMASLMSYFILRDMGGGAEEARTAAFCTIVVSQLLFSFSARDFERPLWKLRRYNRLVLAAGVSLLMQLAVVYLPVVNNVFHTVPLGWEWTVIIPLSLLPLIVNEAWKYLRRRMEHTTEACGIVGT